MSIPVELMSESAEHLREPEIVCDALLFSKGMLSDAASLLDAENDGNLFTEAFYALTCGAGVERFALEGVERVHFDAKECSEWHYQSLIAATSIDHRNLAAAVLDILRASPGNGSLGRSAMLQVRPASSIDGGRCLVGDGATLTIFEEIVVGTALTVYPALYMRGEDACDLQYNLAEAIVDRHLGRESPGMDDSIRRASTERVLDSLLAYDVTNEFPESGPVSGEWVGFGLPFRSPASAMNDVRGGRDYIDFLHSLVEKRTVVSTGGKHAVTLDTGDMEKVWLHSQGAVTCRLQGFTLGGLFPIVAVVANRPMLPGVYEAALDYGTNYWNARARRTINGEEECIPWLHLYAQAHGL